MEALFQLDKDGNMITLIDTGTAKVPICLLYASQVKLIKDRLSNGYTLNECRWMIPCTKEQLEFIRRL